MGLFLLVGAVVEIVAGVLVANQIGAGLTLLLLVVCSLSGAVLLRWVGARAVRHLRAGGPQTPGEAVREAVDTANGIAGALLICLPGFVSTAIGLLLLAPPLRAVARALEGRLLARRLVVVSRLSGVGASGWGGGFGPGPTSSPDPRGFPPDGAAGQVLEGEVLEEHIIREPPAATRPPDGAGD